MVIIVSFKIKHAAVYKVEYFYRVSFVRYYSISKFVEGKICTMEQLKKH